MSNPDRARGRSVIPFLLLSLAGVAGPSSLSIPAARADSVDAGCVSGKQWDAGLCYSQCRVGYNGVAATCWGACPDGYTDTGALCQKGDAYGRGAGTPLGCGDDEDKDGALCYPRCRDGYSGKGPMCWEKDCKSGYKDFGATCTNKSLKTYSKGSYGRGAGSKLHACSGGLEQSGALCYPKCRDGFSGNGPLCSIAPVTKAKDSYGRGGGVVPTTCSTQSFTHTAPAPGDPGTFTMLFASDVQFPWMDSCSGDDACVLRESRRTNSEQIAAENGVQGAGGGHWPDGAAILAPRGLVINGDLTAYWHDYQVDLLQEFYGSRKYMPSLNVFPGLGNHDYANNHNDCQWTRNAVAYPGKNGCALNAVGFMKAVVNCHKMATFDDSLVESFDQGSLAYSWNIGRYHFVQLNFRPNYKLADLSISPSYDWLKTDLARATAAGRKIVLNMHNINENTDPKTVDGQGMTPDDPRLLSAIGTSRVVAGFAGHIHKQVGYQGAMGSTGIPYFLSGASEYQTFLLAEFADDHIKVAVLQSKGGTPSFLDPGNLQNEAVVHLDASGQVAGPAQNPVSVTAANARAQVENRLFGKNANLLGVNANPAAQLAADGAPLLNANGKCLDIDGGDWQAKRNGGKVQSWNCNGAGQQRWRLDGDRLISSNGKCLDVDGGDWQAKRNGGKVQAWDCNGGGQQKWRLDNGRFVSANGKCLDLSGDDFASKRDGGKIQVWDCNGAGPQSGASSSDRASRRPGPVSEGKMRVFLAAQPTDMRRYAEPGVMRSRGADSAIARRAWVAFFTLYRKRMAQLLGIDGAGLNKLGGGLRFTDPEKVGCGPHHPIDCVGKKGPLCRRSRRGTFAR